MINAVQDIDGNYFPEEQGGANLPCATLLMRLRKEEDSQKCIDMLYLTQHLRGAYFTKFMSNAFPPTDGDISCLRKCEEILAKYSWSDILTEQNFGTKCKIAIDGEKIIPITYG